MARFWRRTDTGCWRTEFSTPRFHGVWCLAVDGKAMTGSLRDVPTGKDVRKVQLKRDQ